MSKIRLRLSLNILDLAFHMSNVAALVYFS